MAAERLELASLRPIQWVAVALAAITGTVHLGLGLLFITDPLGASFVLAGAGFFGAIGLFLVGYRRRLLYLVGVPYTATQIVLWYLLNRPTPGAVTPVEAVDKLAQVALIGVLAYLYAADHPSRS